MVNYKRIDDLIRAFKLVEEKIPQARLEIIGIGDEIVSLKKLVNDFQLTDKIYFLGFVPGQIEVWRKIKSAGIFCLPSEVEGFGIATVEAIAAGVPVVLPDIPINREITRNKGVLFYKSLDIRDLSQQLITLMTNKKKNKKLIFETKKLTQAYDWSNIAAQTQKIYENLCIN